MVVVLVKKDHCTGNFPGFASMVLPFLCHFDLKLYCRLLARLLAADPQNGGGPHIAVALAADLDLEIAAGGGLRRGLGGDAGGQSHPEDTGAVAAKGQDQGHGREISTETAKYRRRAPQSLQRERSVIPWMLR